jgi:hypothetical protein
MAKKDDDNKVKEEWPGLLDWAEREIRGTTDITKMPKEGDTTFEHDSYWPRLAKLPASEVVKNEQLTYDAIEAALFNREVLGKGGVDEIMSQWNDTMWSGHGAIDSFGSRVDHILDALRDRDKKQYDEFLAKHGQELLRDAVKWSSDLNCIKSLANRLGVNPDAKSESKTRATGDDPLLKNPIAAPSVGSSFKAAHDGQPAAASPASPAAEGPDRSAGKSPKPISRADIANYSGPAR